MLPRIGGDDLHHRLFPNEFISKSPYQGVKFLRGSSETTPHNDFLRSPEVSGGPSLVGISFSAQLFKCRYLLQYGSTEKSLTCRILTQKVTIPQEFPPQKISTKKSQKKFVSSFQICPQIISRSTATGFCYIVCHLTFDQISSRWKVMKRAQQQFQSHDLNRILSSIP